MCDFHGMKEPEMVKRRPVIVIRASRYGPKLATVVCLSTVEPNPNLDCHMRLPDKFLPKDPFFEGKETWLKGDMIYTLSCDRLDYVKMGKDRNGKRKYFTQKLSRETMAEVYSCALHGVNLGFLSPHLT
ncbi:type II toxin-antitoxin system PemK/MazF family toxin [Vibrio penaeicida]|uniref:type II toxin-antitoxin system PemK/MazF family toxin n=1 Tax=Vibrio penaeicida TaxID=104609 RepID=UPI00351ED4AC